MIKGDRRFYNEKILGAIVFGVGERCAEVGFVLLYNQGVTSHT